jgi:uncharacterized protein
VKHQKLMALSQPSTFAPIACLRGRQGPARNEWVTKGKLAIPLIAIWALIALIQGTIAAPIFPQLTGRIVDEANLLTAADRGALESELKALEDKSTIQLVIYTARSLQGYEIADFGYQLGRAWQIGQQGKNNGVILIVAPGERKVRIEVGRGLEPQLTDATSRLIIENAILPAFRRGNFAAGIKAGVRDIRDVLLGDPEVAKERARSAAKRDAGPDIAAFIVPLLLFIMIAMLINRAQKQQAAYPTRTGARKSYGGPIIIPGSWGSGSGSWNGGFGGGFSGGGGDFGGGGSSGSW